MTRIMANWDLESDITLPDATPYVRYEHPQGKYVIFLRKAPAEETNPLKMSLQVICEAPTLHDASEISEALAKEFLDYLSYATSMKTKLGRPQYIFNWEVSHLEHGVREAIYYHTSPADEPPFAALDPRLLETISLLQKDEIDTRLRRALKWFSNGVAAQYQDDQFAFFWFVVELIAQIMKTVTPVPDRCPKCREPMFCPTCNASHMHRPYPKQAVEALFQRLVRGNPQAFYKQAFRARNMLLHGDEIRSIEQELAIEFSHLVDNMGRLAWTAILNQFAPALARTRPHFLHTNSFVSMNMIFSVDMQIGFTPDFDNPDPATFPKVQLSARYVDPPQAPEPSTN